MDTSPYPDTVIAVIDLPSPLGVGAIACNPTGLYAYATTADNFDTSASTLNVISLSSFTVVDTAHAPTNNAGVALTCTPDGAYVLLACLDGDVYKFRTSDNTYQGARYIGSYPEDICSWASEYVLASRYLGVSKLRVSDMTVVDAGSVSSWPSGVCVLPDQSHVYAGDPNQYRVVVFDSSLVMEAAVDIDAQPRDICCLPAGDYVYAADSYNTVDIIRTSDNAWLGYIYVGANPQFLCPLPSGGYLYCSNYDSGTLSVIDTSTNTVVETIPVGSHPNQVCCTSDGEYVLVACSYGGEVYVLGRSGLGVEGGGAPSGSPGLAVTSPAGSFSASITLPVQCFAEVRIYDLTGRLVASPMSAVLPAGSSPVTCDGLVAGLYSCVLEAGGLTEYRSFVILSR
jgi:YVTN family beta-propeller protein